MNDDSTESTTDDDVTMFVEAFPEVVAKMRALRGT